MIACDKCGKTFEKTKATKYYNKTDSKFFFFSSPCCNSTYSNLKKCDKCGKLVSEKNLRYDLCEECIKDIEKKFTHILDKNFSESEKEFILYDMVL